MMSFRRVENAKVSYFPIFFFFAGTKKVFQNGDCGIQVQQAQPSLTHLATMLTHLETSLVTCRASLADYKVILPYVGAILARPRNMLIHLRAILAHLGT